MADFTAGEVLTAVNLNNAINGPTLNAQTGTTYTLVASDAGKVVTMNNASAITLTVPAESSVAFETGTAIGIVQLGAGTVTVAGAGGVTVNGIALSLGDQYAAAQLYYLGSDTWVLVGNVA